MDANLINWEDKKVIETLKATVAVGATDAEFGMFAAICKSTGLNPFKREIWFIKTKGYRRNDGTEVDGKVQIMTGIAGYLSIANSNPNFDGMECEIERDKDGKPIRAVAKAWRKDRKHPSVGEAMFSEYYQKGREYKGEYKPSIWDQKPSIMIAKVAKSIALREAFPQELSSLYTEEEMPREYSSQAIETSSYTPSVTIEPEKQIAPPVERQEITRPCKYAIPDATENTKRFFEKRGGYFDEALNLWLAPAPLEREAPKLAQYRVRDSEIREEEAA